MQNTSIAMAPFRLTALLLICSTLFTGCALYRGSQAPQTEQMLVAAGFQARPATTDQQVTSLKTLPAYKITTRSKGKKVLYIYPDPKQGILYVGGPAEYKAFSQLAYQQNITHQQLQAAEDYQTAAEEMNYWSDWAIWGPYWW